MNILIRSLTAEDLPEVFVVEQICQLFPWTLTILKDCLAAGYSGWVAVEQNQIVGYTMMSFSTGECHVLNICVLPAARRKGYAKLLMQALLAESQKLNADIVFLEVRASNHAALKLYNQFGFNEIGIRKGYYPALNKGREDAVILGYQF